MKNKLNKNKWSGTFIVDYIPTKHSDDIMIVCEGKLYKKFYGLFRKVKKEQLHFKMNKPQPVTTNQTSGTKEVKIVEKEWGIERCFKSRDGKEVKQSYSGSI